MARGKFKLKREREATVTEEGKVTTARSAEISGTTKTTDTTVSTQTPVDAGAVSPSLAGGVPKPIDLSKTPAGQKSGGDTTSSEPSEGSETSQEPTEENPEGGEKTDEEGEKEEGDKEGEEEENPEEENPETPEEPAPEGGEKPGPEGDQSEVSPSIKDEDLKHKKPPRERTTGTDVKNSYGNLKNAWAARKNPGEAGKEAANAAVKKAAKELAKKAALYVWDAIVAFFGWEVVLIIVAICLVIIIIAAGLSCTAMSGVPGKTYPKTAKSDSDEVKKLNDLKGQKADDTNSYNRLNYLDSADDKFVNDGKADERMLKAIAYIVEKHTRIAISHIISAYQDMPGTENKEQDPQLVKNISAHKEGLAGDIAQIDFVYKVFEENAACPKVSGVQLQDIVYYGDGSKEASNDINTSGGAETDSADDTGPVTDSSGNVITNAELAAKLAELQNSINANIDGLNQAINDTQNTINANRDKIIAGLPEEQRGSININIDPTIATNNELKNQLTTVTNQLRDYNQKLTELQTSIDQAISKAEITNLTNQLQTAQRDVLQATAKVDQINNAISNLSDKINIANSDITEFIAGNQVAIAESIRSLTDGLSLSINLKNISPMLNIPNFNLNIDIAKAATDAVNQAVRDTVNDQIGQLAGDFGVATGNLGGVGGVFGGGANQLLRLYCEGVPGTLQANAKYSGKDAEAIPLRVSWQDRKPDVVHVDNSSDDAVGIDPRVYSMVYQPESRKKIHQVIHDLLQFAYDSGNKDYYKVTQLITYSQERDVTPFATTLDKLYGKVRPANYGLFSMPEAWGQIHIGY